MYHQVIIAQQNFTKIKTSEGYLSITVYGIGAYSLAILSPTHSNTNELFTAGIFQIRS